MTSTTGNSNSMSKSELVTNAKQMSQLSQSVGPDACARMLTKCSSTQSSEYVVMDEKAAKIKKWVTSRLKELEAQNELLRQQNVKCTRQLEVLRSCAGNSASWRNSFFQTSHDGSVSLQASVIQTEEEQLDTTSDDSGTTSDIRGSSPLCCSDADRSMHDCPLSGRSEERHPLPLTCSTNCAVQFRYPQKCPSAYWADNRLSRSLNGSLERGLWEPTYAVVGFTTKENQNLNVGGGGYQLPRQSNSEKLPRKKYTVAPSCLDTHVYAVAKKKPVPMPRRNVKDDARRPSQKSTTGFDRDSLDPFRLEDDACPTRPINHGSATVCHGNQRVNSNRVSARVGARDVSSRGGDPIYMNMVQTNDTTACECPGVVDNGQTEHHHYSNMNVCNTRDKVPVQHRIPSWESRLYKTAEKCLKPKSQEPKTRTSIFSVYEPFANSGHCGAASPSNSASSETLGDRTSLHLPVYTTFHGRVAQKESGESTGSWCTSGSSSTSASAGCKSATASMARGSQRLLSRSKIESENHVDYAVPPDAGLEGSMETSIHCYATDGDMESLMSHHHLRHIYKSGYVNKFQGDRFKSWKRRWMVLQDEQVFFYRSQEDAAKGKTIMKMTFAEVSSVQKLKTKEGTGFELQTKKGTYKLSAETFQLNDEWIKLFQRVINEKAAMSASHRGGVISGWVNRVKYGHSKACWATLAESKLSFFKTSTDKTPIAQLSIRGYAVTEASRSSDSDTNSEDGYPQGQNYSVSLQDPRNPQEITYIVLQGREEKERWLFHLNLAATGGKSHGDTELSLFEQHIQRLMTDDGAPDSRQWLHAILCTSDETIAQPLTTMRGEGAAAKKEQALGMWRSCYMFSSVPARHTALDYHVDLAQSTLSIAQSGPELQDELFCQLVKLTCSPLPTIQAFELLALALSLFLPNHYGVSWLLQKHLQKCAAFRSEAGKFAQYCQRVLSRCRQNGPRKQRVSRMEATAMFSRRPYEHSTPYSIPVHLPSETYQLIGFDGSSTVAECMDTVATVCGTPVTAAGGWVLMHDDPQMPDVFHRMQPKAKICDVVSEWEQKVMENRAGKFPSNRIIRIQLTKRFHFRSHVKSETDRERALLAYQLSAEIQRGIFPMDSCLAQDITALMSQLHFGDFDPSCVQTAVAKFYPSNVSTTESPSLWETLSSKWKELNSLSASECARIYLSALRKWPHTGSMLFESTMRWRGDERIWIGVNELGIDLLARDTTELIIHYPYEYVLTFGGCRDDFMLVTSRTTSFEGEPTKERLIFAMEKPMIHSLTMLVADYIRFRKQVYSKKPAKQKNGAPPRSALYSDDST